MIELQIRRHSIQGINKHLSPHGVKLAQLQNEKPFDLVITSPLQRAMETAIALGSAITETNEILGFLPETVQSSIPFSAGFINFHKALRADHKISDCSRLYRKFIQACLEGLNYGERALFISHAGTVEMLILACVPDLPVQTLPHSVSQLEGATIMYNEAQFEFSKFLRVDPGSVA